MRVGEIAMVVGETEKFEVEFCSLVDKFVSPDLGVDGDTLMAAFLLEKQPATEKRNYILQGLYHRWLKPTCLVDEDTRIEHVEFVTKGV